MIKNIPKRKYLLAKEIIRKYEIQQKEKFEVRWKEYENGLFFKDEELIYSAIVRCHCGLGLAHPIGGIVWRCSSVYNGINDKKCLSLKSFRGGIREETKEHTTRLKKDIKKCSYNELVQIRENMKNESFREEGDFWL